MIPGAMHRIEAQQMRSRLCIASDLIDMSDLKVRRIPGGSECQTPNATKAVNAHVYCHNEGLSRIKNQISDKPAPRNGTG
jgi:hypothetical protein